MRHALDRAAWLCVLLVAAFVPLVSANFTALGFNYPIVYDQHFIVRAALGAVLAIAGLAAVLWWSRATGAPLRFHRSQWALVAFFGLASVSAALSGDRFEAVFGQYTHYEGLLTLATYAAVLFTVMQTVTGKRLTTLARSIAYSGAVVSVYGISQSLGFDPTNWLTILNFEPGRAFSTWGNPDFLGGYLIFPLVFSAALLWVEEQRAYKVGAAVTFALSAAALGSTVTRGAWLAAVVGIALLVVLRWSAGDRKGMALAGALAAVAVLVVAVAGRELLVTRIMSTFSPSDSGVGGRFTVWRVAMDIIASNPMTGTGPDSFIRATKPLHVALGYIPNDAHNYPLQLAATLGVPAAVAMYGFFGWALAAGRGVLQSGPASGSRVLAGAAWVAAVAHLVHLMFGVSITASTALLFVCLGVVLAPVATAWEPRPSARAGMPLAATVALGAVIVAAAMGLAMDASMMRARAAAHDGGPRLMWARRAVLFGPGYERYRLELISAEARENAREGYTAP